MNTSMNAVKVCSGFVVALFALATMPQLGRGHSIGPIEYDVFNVHALGNRAAVCLIDDQGRRTGANPNGTYDQDGLTEDFLREIPNAVTDVSITGNDDEDDPAAKGKAGSLATWSILVGDRGAAVYILEFIGLKDGVASAQVSGGSEVGSDLHPDIRIDAVVERGRRPQFAIAFDPDRGLLEVRRRFEPGDLTRSLRIVCRLGGLSSTGICQSLEAKVSVIEKAAGRNRWSAARGAGKAYLNELAAIPESKITRNSRTHLRAEMQAYLDSLGRPPLKLPKGKPKRKT